jgi:signal transduction histidine kinase
LLAALRTYARLFSARCGLPVRVSGDEIAPRLSTIIETAMFRIAQEALANIAKHACATRVEISLVTIGQRVEFSITDDGVGFDAALAKPEGMGLRTMRERAEAVGADLRVESTPGKGTRAIVTLARETA